MGILIKETFVNETRGHTFGETEPYEPFTDDIGRLFRSMQKEYGRCTSKLYIEPPKGSGKADYPSGWVFSKRMEYEGYRGRGDRYYIREVWVEVRHVADES